MSSDDEFLSGPMNKTKSGAVAPKPSLPWILFGNEKTITEPKFLKNVGMIIDLDGTAKYTGDIEFKSFTPTVGILESQFGEEDDEEEESNEDNEDESEGEDVGEKFQKHLHAIYVVLKDAKTAGKTVLLVSKRQYYIGLVIVSYMLRSTKALDKYLSLKQALDFIKSKDINLEPKGQLLLHLIVLEEALFDEVSVKLPGGGAFRSGGTRKAKPSGNRRRK